MTERDDELRGLLRQWEAPPWDTAMDRPVLNAVLARPPRRWRRWGAMVACLALAAGAAVWQAAKPSDLTQSRVSAADLRPLEDGAIRVWRIDRKGRSN
jgi:hypothetical protein